MRKHFFLVIAFNMLFISTIISQQQKRVQPVCGDAINLERIKQADPARYNRIQAYEKGIQDYLSSPQRLINNNGVIMIPVVVHILHNGEAVGVGRNLSDAQVLSQIDALNDDFGQLNPDRFNAPAVFQAVGGNPNIQFRLACVDPTGAATTGITRRVAGQTAFLVHQDANGTNEQTTGIKFTSTGGEDAWPTDRYLNIWVCDMNLATALPNEQLLGYAQFPFDFATKPNTDGVVIFFESFGRGFFWNNWFNFDRGHTASHEIAHWLNVYHLTGDSPCGDDFVADTPPEQQLIFNCENFPFINCNNGPNGQMFMNFMEYTDDECRNMFTGGQAARMRFVFAPGNGTRWGLINNTFSINPRGPFCTSATLTVNNPLCLPITWSVSSGPATVTSTGPNTALVQKTTDGYAIIKASSGNYESEIGLAMGAPSANFARTLTTNGATNPLETCNRLTGPVPGGAYNGYVSVSDPFATSYGWSLFNKGSNTATQLFNSPNAQNVEIRVKAPGNDGYATYQLSRSNSCGSTSNYYTFRPNIPCAEVRSANPTDVDIISDDIKELLVYPNPAKREITITDAKNIYAIKITDATGRERKRIEYKSGMRTVNVSLPGLTPGLYFVSVFDGKNWSGRQLIIEK